MHIFINEDMEFCFNLVSNDKLSLKSLVRNENFKEYMWIGIGGKIFMKINSKTILVRWKSVKVE